MKFQICKLLYRNGILPPLIFLSNKLTDKAWHAIFEVVFKITLTEKHAYFKSDKARTKTGASTQLTICADTIKILVRTSAPKLKGKTVEAIVDHITQTLPTNDGGYCSPLVNDYLKALIELFRQQENVELLKREVWLDIIGFCIEGVTQYVNNADIKLPGFQRSLSILSDGSKSASVAMSAMNTSRIRNDESTLTRQNVEDYFQILSFLLRPPQAPLSTIFSEIAEATIHFLHLPGSIGQMHQIAFSILNTILRTTCVDHIFFTKSLARKAIPLISRIFEAKALAKDAMLNSVRDGMLIFLIFVHCHLERMVEDDDEVDFILELEELLDVLRADYSRRTDRETILQLDHLILTNAAASTSETYPFQLLSFQLRPFADGAERIWACLQIIGILEKILSTRRQLATLKVNIKQGDWDDRHPRKRQKYSQTSNRLLGPLRADEENLRLAGLHALPFVLEQCQLPAATLSDVLAQLRVCANDKRGDIISWALLGIAR
jgi:ataxia telangiectasia mutated family protein